MGRVMEMNVRRVVKANGAESRRKAQNARRAGGWGVTGLRRVVKGTRGRDYSYGSLGWCGSNEKENISFSDHIGTNNRKSVKQENSPC